MVRPVAGAVVIVPFPFSELSQTKRRPALGIADAGHGDWILCQITSNPAYPHKFHHGVIAHHQPGTAGETIHCELYFTAVFNDLEPRKSRGGGGLMNINDLTRSLLGGSRLSSLVCWILYRDVRCGRDRPFTVRITQIVRQPGSSRPF